MEAYKAMKIIFTHIMRITEEEFEQMLTDYEKECNEVTLCKTQYRAIILKRLDAYGGWAWLYNFNIFAEYSCIYSL